MSSFTLKYCFTLLAIPLLLSGAGWRGEGSGRFPSANPPISWSETKNIIWRANIGKSYSTPVISGDKIFAACEPDILACIDKLTGKILWSKRTGLSNIPEADRTKWKPVTLTMGYSIPTPVSDGTNVYVLFGSGIAACYSEGGDVKWVSLFQFPRANEYGRIPSPVLAGGKLCIFIDHLFALDLSDGRTLFEVKEAKELYGTPAVVHFKSMDYLATSDGMLIDASSGKTLATGIGNVTNNSPVAGGDCVYFIDSVSNKVQLVPGKDGPEVKELWNTSIQGDEFFASPLIDNGLVYTVSNNAVFSVLDAETGAPILSKKLDIVPYLYQSLSLAGKTIFLGNNLGRTAAIEPGKEGKVLSINDLSLGSESTPVFEGNRAYFRGGDFLYCIGEK